MQTLWPETWPGRSQLGFYVRDEEVVRGHKLSLKILCSRATASLSNGWQGIARLSFRKLIKLLKPDLTRVFLFVQAVIRVRQTFRRNVDDDAVCHGRSEDTFTKRQKQIVKDAYRRAVILRLPLANFSYTGMSRPDKRYVLVGTPGYEHSQRTPIIVECLRAILIGSHSSKPETTSAVPGQTTTTATNARELNKLRKTCSDGAMHE